MEVSLKDLRELFNGGDSVTAVETPFVVGKCYLIRSVTNYLVGRVTRQVGGFVELENVSWVADTGKFSKCWVDGDFKEVELIRSKQYGMGLGAIVDYGLWEHPLPTVTK